MIRNPVEFCLDVIATNTPSNYAGHPQIVNNQNEEMNFQDQGHNPDAPESSRKMKLVLDHKGKAIDLNYHYEDDENDQDQDYDQNQDQVRNAKKKNINKFDLNTLPDS